MKSWNDRLIAGKMETLRICALVVLLGTALGMTLEQPAALQTDPQTLPLKGMIVALDPGHGGYDGGARAHDSGMWEKELTLRIALETEKELIRQGAQVVLTRRSDICLSDEGSGKTRKRADLQKRRQMAEQAGAHVLLSIHLNEYRSRAESGPQVFYQKGATQGRALAEMLQQAMVEGLQPQRKRVAMAGDYYVLRGKLPSALVECGFLSNAQEERLLMDEAYHRRIAQSVAQGLKSWRELYSDDL